MLRKILFSIVVFCCVASLLPACSCGKRKKGTPGANDKIYPVKITSPIAGEVPDLVDLQGVFIPNDRLSVKTPYSGKATQIAAAEGQRVNPGDALCRIQNDHLSLILDKQRAELREEELKLEGIRTGEENGGNRLGDNRAPFDLDTVGNEEEPPDNQNPSEEGEQPANEEGSEERNEEPNLFALSKQPAKQQQPREEPESKSGLQQAKIDRLRAEIALNERMLTEGTIVATVGGLITKKYVSEGSLVQADTVLFEIVDVDPILLSVFVPQKLIQQLNQNTPVKVIDKNDPGQLLNGEVAYISAEFNIDKKGLEIRVRVPNPNDKLKVNLEGTARLALSTKTRKVLLIPPGAITHANDGKTFVYVAKGNLAEKKEIEVGLVQNGQAAIIQGLSVKDQVITQGHQTFDEPEEYIKIE
ncbi:MAG: efflux RND transporter periplasmic adaptor subunit [Deltaproteobacteria bacterium]|nr:efflux RND transporter periplasmic adaptor subunit [Deltaproteobacteria bacterium]